MDQDVENRRREGRRAPNLCIRKDTDELETKIFFSNRQSQIPGGGVQPRGEVLAGVPRAENVQITTTGQPIVFQ